MRIIFAGTPDFAAVALQTLLDSSHEVVAVYTQPDRPAGRGRKVLASPVKMLAEQYQIPIYQPATLKTAETQAELFAIQADILVVAAYGLILPLAVLTHLPCINIHASLLPRWRGASPIHQAILAGDQESGVTIMEMTEGLDEGDMLYKLSCPITADMTTSMLHDRLALLGGKACLEALALMQSGKLQPQKQDDSLACYAPKITKAEALIDWRCSSAEIERKVRAFVSWPVAQTRCGDQVVRVWKAQVVSTEKTSTPGTIMNVAKIGIDVATGDGVLRILKIQLPGGKPLPIADILNAKPEFFVEGQLCHA